MSVPRKSWPVLTLLGIAVAVIGGCQEQLASGAACPSLCPDTLVVKDTVFSGKAAFDTITTVVGIPPLGTETSLLVGDFTQGGSPVQTAAIMRFDSLVRIFPDTDTTAAKRPFTRVDSSALSIIVIPPTDSTKDTILVPDSITFVVYDVNVNAPDFDTAAVHARLNTLPIASRVVPRDSVKGAIRIPLDTGWVAQHVRNGVRIRLGLRIQSALPAQIVVGSTEGSQGATLQYFGYADTSRSFITRGVNTVGEPGTPTLKSLSDYDLVLQGTPPPPPGILAAGGIPGSRIYMRFNVPAVLIDSSATIVRANLILHQAANLTFFPSDTTDTILLQTRVVQATPFVTDIGTAALLVADPATLGATGIPTSNLRPNTEHPDTIPIVGLFILWKRVGPRASQRALVLKSSAEGIDPQQYFFYSLDAPNDTLRPRLEISYILKSGFGLP
ncbi:MAG TPA: hypothetical protein VIC55_03450 [Gemmatimonadaceae bacterium]